MRVEFTAGSDDHDRRLESVLRRLLPGQSLGALHKALRTGDVRLNGAKASPEHHVRTGDTIAVWDALVTPEATRAQASAGAVLPENWILFTGPDLLVVSKPSGVLVHRGSGRGADPPLDELVRNWLAPTSASSLSFRPGPLHRIDRETSGLVVFSRTLAGARAFSEALAQRRVAKTYLAVLRGDLDGPREATEAIDRDTGTRTSAAGSGQAALTQFRPLARAGGLTLAEVDLGTGRTHQIRVHAQSLGFPLAGDSKYGGGPTPTGLEVPWVLHAWKLSCDVLPPLTAPLDPRLAAWIKKEFKKTP